MGVWSCINAQAAMFKQRLTLFRVTPTARLCCRMRATGRFTEPVLCYYDPAAALRMAVFFRCLKSNIKTY